ncbi:MAG TPA: hypothetical protein PKA10_00955 [Selenomonadales bacterium]|nr:hypothetical protein [Selenomonadales bacterium]
MLRKNYMELNWKPTPPTWLSVLLLMLLLPLGLTLPIEWGWENGPLENTQVLVLGCGLAVTLFAARQNCGNRKARNLWRWLALFWLLCIGRELSWGRVFYQVAIGEHGPKFIAIDQLRYGFLVNPVTILLALIMLVGICRNGPLTYLRRTELPAWDIIVFILAAGLNVWFEKGASTIPFLYLQEEVLEEWAELAAYWSLVSIAIAGYKNYFPFGRGMVNRQGFGNATPPMGE